MEIELLEIENVLVKLLKVIPPMSIGRPRNFDRTYLLGPLIYLPYSTSNGRTF